MTIQKIIKKIRSGIFKLEFYLDGKLVNSGSGFIYKGRLITNNHVLNPEGHIFNDDTKIKIVFGDGDTFDITKKDLILEHGSDESSFDYAVLKTDKFDYSKKYNFELSSINEEIEEGDDVFIFGFPFELENMTSHFGRISALYSNGDIKIIQIDASINSGNSGGPLFHYKTGRVVGVITRKATGLTEGFDNLIKSFDQNINLFNQLAKAGGSVMLMGINPIKYMEVSQNQMKMVAQEIKRSSNVGIGYAFDCGKIITDLQ